MDTMIEGIIPAFIFSFICFYLSFKIWKPKETDVPSYFEDCLIPLMVAGVYFLIFGVAFIVIGLLVY